MSVRIRRCLAASLVFLWLPAWPQQSLMLSAALRTAIDRSQQVVAADAALAALAEAAVAAGQLPDPVLTLAAENVPLAGPDRFSLTRDFMTMRRIGVMQEITRGEKRSLRVERVQQDAKRLQAERRQTIARIERETALAWIDRRYGEATVQLLQQQLQEAQLQIEGAELAFRTGRGSQADVFAGRAAAASLRDKLRLAQRQSEAARLVLARWTGAEAAAVPVAGEVPWKDAPAGIVVLQQLEALPAIALLQAELAAAETELRQAQASLRPDVTVEAAYQRRGPAFPDMFSIGVTIPLPIARAQRQDREVAAKLAALDAARARLLDAQAAEEAALRVALNEWGTGRERLERLREELLPAARNRTQAALAAYAAASGDLAIVLAARRDELEARMQILSLEMETARSWARSNFVVPQDATRAKEKP
jgi:outer membrane protein TolC